MKTNKANENEHPVRVVLYDHTKAKFAKKENLVIAEFKERKNNHVRK